MTVCPTCGNSYSHIGKHWRGCEYPDFSHRQKEIIEGMVLGDGCIHTDGVESHNCWFTAQMVNQPFLHWLSDELGIFSLGVKFKESAEKAAERCAEQGIFKTINEENYHDSYYVQSRSHPSLNEIRDKFYTDGKVVPDGLEPTPLMMKMWYVSDGSLCWDRDNRATVRFGIRAEQSREQFFTGLFDDLGFDIRRSGRNYKMPVGDSEDFLDWIGESPPGFCYKWELFNKGRYETLMSNQYEV